MALGLELTETSCHTTEASHLEEVLYWAHGAESRRFRFNKVL